MTRCLPNRRWFFHLIAISVTNEVIHVVPGVSTLSDFMARLMLMTHLRKDSESWNRNPYPRFALRCSGPLRTGNSMIKLRLNEGMGRGG